MGGYEDGFASNRDSVPKYYCVKHKITYSLREECPECRKVRLEVEQMKCPKCGSPNILNGWKCLTCGWTINDIKEVE